MKEKIPNILTILRIILTPIIVIMGIKQYIYIVIILVVVAALTDFLDGYIARKWKITSITGAKLDTIADKLFAIGLLGCLVGHFSILIISCILEIILAVINLYYHFKTNKTNSLMIGKIKTASLFITVIIGIITTFFPITTSLLNALAYVTINLQILSIINYSLDYFFPKKELTIEDNEAHQKIMMQNEELEQTIILNNLKQLTVDYDYVKDDIY